MQERHDERMLSRVPPHSREAEESVIGAILMSDHAAAEVMDKLEPEDFYVPAHQSIFGAIRTLFNNNQAIDAITVSEELRKTGDLERIGGVPAITRLLDVVPSAANVEYYASIVDEHAQRRGLIKAGATVTDFAFRLDDEIHSVLDRSEQAVLAVAQRRVGDSMQPIGSLFEATLLELELLEQRGSEVTGLSTGFRDLDRKLTGLHPANLVIIAARPAMGKCLVGSTLVIDPKTGARVRMDELVRNDRLSTAHVMALDVTTMELETAAPVAAVDNGVRPVFRVRTGLGREITTTANHPFLTVRGWRELTDLDIGDEVAVAGRIDVFGVDELPDEEVVLLAQHLGSALLRPGAMVEAGVDPSDERLRETGLHEQEARERFVPESIFRLPERQAIMFLSRLFGAAGSTPASEPTDRIEFATASHRLAHDVQHLLLRLGIVASVRSFQTPNDEGLVVHVLSIEGPDAAADVAALLGGASPGRTRAGVGGDVLFDPIVSIEPAGQERTYDIEVPVHHNFVAEDVVVHNSALTMNIATNVAMTGLPVAIFSLEMSKEEVAQRMLCSVARIDSMKVRTGNIGEASWPRLTDAAGKLYNAPVYVDDSPVVTVTDIRAKCRRLKRQHGLELVVVDYMQLMQGTTRENRQQEIAEISRALKNLARELELPIIAVSQLNRNLEQREDKRPRLGDLRESGSLEQDADIVMFIYRDEYYNEQSDRRGVAEVIVAKHRAGSTGTVDMTFMPEYTRFSDIGRD